MINQEQNVMAGEEEIPQPDQGDAPPIQPDPPKARGWY